MIQARYDIAREATRSSLTASASGRSTLTDRLDRVLLHPVFGTMIFVAIMAAVFQSVFAWAAPMMDGIEALVGILQEAAQSVLPTGALQDLLVHGVIGGVGNVIVFVPQIGILFAFIALLEDSGYLARAAFISDRWMARIGLHGRAFVPLLSGFACAVPAIMATRSIESRRDRLVTILVAPLVSCSARLPVYTLIIAALFAADARVVGVFTLGGLLMLAMYALSLAFTIGVAFVLKRTVLKSPTPPLVLELPPYRRPELSNVLLRAYERCMVFVRDAGTVILACSIVLWALLYFPRDAPMPPALQQEVAALEQAEAAGNDDPALAATRERVDAQMQGARIRNSFAGRIGRGIDTDHRAARLRLEDRHRPARVVRRPRGLRLDDGSRLRRRRRRR